jgi:hypothetical protein
VQNRPEKKKKDATGQGVIYEGYQRNIKGILEEYKRGDGGKTRWWAGNLSPSTHWSSEREFKKKKKKKKSYIRTSELEVVNRRTSYGQTSSASRIVHSMY